MSSVKSDLSKYGEFILDWKVKEEEFKKSVKNCRNILIAGFPVMGMAIPYHLKEKVLKDSEKILDLYFYYLPAVADCLEEEFEIPHDEIWYSKEKELFIYIGKYPETKHIPKSIYKHAEFLAKLLKELHIKEIYTIGITTHFQGMEAFICFFSDSKKKIPDGCERAARKNNIRVFGKTGLLPGFASKIGIESYSILGMGKNPEDLGACAGALRAFKKLSGIEMETTEIERIFEKSSEIYEGEMIGNKVAYL
jgi:proteasome assembly chaperone (PAC2) family protein